MDVDKSLYMKEFLEIRNRLGCVHNLEAPHTLDTNLYNEFLPREIKKKVEKVVEEIEEKTIFLGNKNKSLFDDLPEKGATPVGDIHDKGVDAEPIEEEIEPIEDEESDKSKESDKPINVEPIEEDILDIDLTGGGRELKKIVINPNYVALDN